MAFNVNSHLMDLTGKAYLQVMWRLVWFREEHPEYGIHTDLVEHDKAEHSAVFKAVITDENGSILSTGFGSESIKDFRDYLEKAETKAVGRALAMLGYGTQFAPEMDEGERIVDSPVPSNKPKDFVMKSGKFRGMKLGDIFNADGGIIYLQQLMDSDAVAPALKVKIGAVLNG